MLWLFVVQNHQLVPHHDLIIIIDEDNKIQDEVQILVLDKDNTNQNLNMDDIIITIQEDTNEDHHTITTILLLLKKNL
jgi:DNA helicase IV